VLLSDGVLLGDGVLLSDAILQAYSAMMAGDPTPEMETEVDTGGEYTGF
jgi:hypothetical protein